MVVKYKIPLSVSFHSLWKWSTKQSLWLLHQHFKIPDRTEEIRDTFIYILAVVVVLCWSVSLLNHFLPSLSTKNFNLHFQQRSMYCFKDSMNICFERIINRLVSAYSKENLSFKYISNNFQTEEGEKEKKWGETSIFSISVWCNDFSTKDKQLSLALRFPFLPSLWHEND